MAAELLRRAHISRADAGQHSTAGQHIQHSSQLERQHASTSCSARRSALHGSGVGGGTHDTLQCMAACNINKLPLNCQVALPSLPLPLHGPLPRHQSATATATAYDNALLAAANATNRRIYHSSQTPGFTAWLALWPVPGSTIKTDDLAMRTSARRAHAIQGYTGGPPTAVWDTWIIQC